MCGATTEMKNTPKHPGWDTIQIAFWQFPLNIFVVLRLVAITSSPPGPSGLLGHMWDETFKSSSHVLFTDSG